MDDHGSNGDDVDIGDDHYDDDRNDEKEMVASDLFVFVFVFLFVFVFVFVFSLVQRRRREGNEKEMVAGVWPLTPRQLQLVREREGSERCYLLTSKYSRLLGQGGRGGGPAEQESQ